VAAPSLADRPDWVFAHRLHNIKEFGETLNQCKGFVPKSIYFSSQCKAGYNLRKTPGHSLTIINRETEKEKNAININWSTAGKRRFKRLKTSNLSFGDNLIFSF
jgi:hypothetical protein